MSDLKIKMEQKLKAIALRHGIKGLKKEAFIWGNMEDSGFGPKKPESRPKKHK